jgi:hypothetical protein
MIKYQNTVIQPGPERLHAVDDYGYCVAAILAEVRKGGWIIGYARCRQFRFAPISPFELAPDLATIDAVEKIDRLQRGYLAISSSSDVVKLRDRFKAWGDYM